MLGVNVLGTLTVTRSFAVPMLERGRGSVIVVGTRGSALLPAAAGVWRGLHPGYRNQPYDASKAALCSLSLYLAEELKDRGVAVNVVFPGPTHTTGSAEIAAARRQRGIDERPMLRPGHLVPLLMHLACQTPAGETGLAIDSLQWNRDHGFGDVDKWWYRGMTTLDVLVRSVRLEADRIISLELVRPEGGELPAWTPGAHIDLVLPSGRLRQYSLCGDPAQRLAYRIAVLRENLGRGGSAEIHDTALVGRVLACRPPRNHFELVDASGYVFVAGGIGVTPILPMISQVAAGARPWSCYYGGRSLRSMAFVDEVLAAGSTNVTLWPEDERGLLDLPGILARADAGTAVYCCGPEGLLTAMETACAEAGCAGRLHTERFGQAPDAARQAGAGAVTDRAFQVVLRRSGIELQVPADRTLLDVVREAVPTILSDCTEGYCGTCETKVIEGVPEHRDTVLSDAEKAGNQVMMICVGRSRTPTLVLDI